LLEIAHSRAPLSRSSKFSARKRRTGGCPKDTESAWAKWWCTQFTAEFINFAHRFTFSGRD
jgi:hypothetical protein